MKKIIALVLALSMILCFAACSKGNAGAEKEKVGLIKTPLPASELKADFEVKEGFKFGLICLHDENSTYDLNFLNGFKAACEAAGLVEGEDYIIKTNIGENQECYDAAKDLVEQGCTMVFADSFSHEDFMIQAAKEFPDVQFLHATGVKAHVENLPNYHNAFANIYEGRYLAGIAAGLKLNEMIEAGDITAEGAKMGYVGAYTYAEVISGYTSFYLGAKSVCPSVTMDVQFTGTWYGEDVEKEAANTLISKGAVLVSQHADSMGAPTACEIAGVPNVSYNGSTYDACEETFIVSSRIDWAPYFLYAMGCVESGAAIDTDWVGTIETGSVVLTDINGDVATKDTLDAMNTAIAGFKNKTLHVFDTANFTVDGKKLDSYKVEDKEAISDGYFHESELYSAPAFDIRIDGITLLNELY